MHTSRESSWFQMAINPSLASTVIVSIIALTVTPDVTCGRDTLHQTQSQCENVMESSSLHTMTEIRDKVISVSSVTGNRKM